MEDNEFIHDNSKVKLNLSGSHLVNYNSRLKILKQSILRIEPNICKLFFLFLLFCSTKTPTRGKEPTAGL